MTFEEAMTRARAAHVVVRSYRQPGNDYELEYECKCGAGQFGSIRAKNWDAHILAEADNLLAASEPESRTAREGTDA